MNSYLLCEPTASDVAETAARWLVDSIRIAVEKRDRCIVALAGGSTPKQLYQNLAALPEHSVPWDKVHLVWGDERNVPLDHEQSNFHMVRKAMLHSLGKKGPNVYPIPIDVDHPDKSADYYEATLRALIGPTSNDHTLAPSSNSGIDVAILGLGDDCHTASLFPESKALNEHHRWVVCHWIPKLEQFRITLTYPVFNAAHKIAFLVCGANKQTALRKVWNDPMQVQLLPAQGIRPVGGELWWFTDQAAIDSVPVPSSIVRLK